LKLPIESYWYFLSLVSASW